MSAGSKLRANEDQLMPSFTTKDVENAAVDAELPDAAKAESQLYKTVVQVPPEERLDFLKAVAKQTEDDHNANWSLPTLQVTNDAIVRTDPSRIERFLHTVNPFSIPEEALRNVGK
jgi:hypothetical protein